MNKAKKKLIDSIIKKSPDCGIELSCGFATCHFGLRVNTDKTYEELQAEIVELKKGNEQCLSLCTVEEDAKEICRLQAELDKVKKDSKWYENKLRNCICPNCGFGFSGV